MQHLKQQIFKIGMSNHFSVNVIHSMAIWHWMMVTTTHIVLYLAATHIHPTTLNQSH